MCMYVGALKIKQLFDEPLCGPKNKILHVEENTWTHCTKNEKFIFPNKIIDIIKKPD